MCLPGRNFSENQIGQHKYISCTKIELLNMASRLNPFGISVLGA